LTGLEEARVFLAKKEKDNIEPKQRRRKSGMQRTTNALKEIKSATHYKASPDK
jgi:hypothetical protein